MAALQGGGQGMNNLTTLIKRLEAATSRLEDIASSSSSSSSSTSAAAIPPSNGSPRAPTDANHVGAAVVEVGVASLEQSAPGTPQQSGSGTSKTAGPPPLPKSIEAMDELIDSEVKSFVEASNGLDELVEEQALAVAKAFADQRRFLLTATKAKKPDPQSKALMTLLTDLQQDMSSVGDVRDNHRGSPMKEHLAMVGEGITALQWLIMDGKPADFVGEVTGGAQMYGNRVLKAYKERDQTHVKYVQAYYALLKALRAYILNNYASGVTWNNNGINAEKAYLESDPNAAPTTNGDAVPSTSAGGPPPPPPPPPPPLPIFDNAGPPPPPPPGPAPTNAASGGDMGAVFDQLNRGEAVTAGLKKVDKSQMTHKNPSLRAGSAVPDKSADINRTRSPGPQIKPKPPSMRQNSAASTPSTTTTTAAAAASRKPEKKELDGNKWLIENFDSPSAPIELDVTLTQSILISNCKKTTIVLNGKANAISIDNSPRVQLLVENLVSSIDIIKSPNVAVQVTGSLPTLLLDQVDGATVYLSPETLEVTELFSSKCSGINVVLPPAKDEDDSVECPVPEQIRTTIKGGKLVSEIVEHAG